MSIYNISYDQKAVELLPPDKRTPIHVSWVKAMYGQLKYLRDFIFSWYKTGLEWSPFTSSGINQWDTSLYSNTGDCVYYGEKVYVSKIDNNNTIPTSNNYYLLQDNFIGVDERVMFNANKLVLEYALNKRFASLGAIFRQPPATSDIYIVKNALSLSVFVVGANEEQSSISYANNSTEVIINDYTFATYYNFTIMVKSTIYNMIDPINNDPIVINQVIRNYVDRYNTIGLTYDIQTY